MIATTPRWVTISLMAAMRGHESVMHKGWWLVDNPATNHWLLERFGVVTGEQPDYNLDNAFKLHWDWNLQMFYVSA